MDEKSIFLEAVDKQGNDRTAWLDDTCGQGTPLRQRVEALLEQHQQASGFLEEPIAQFEATMLESGQSAQSSSPAVCSPPSVLKLLEQQLDSVPRVSLRTADREGIDPIVRPTSPEVPHRDADSRYQIQGEIARGGMGAIIKGRDTDLGRDLAIKVLLDSHREKPEVVQRFIEEAQIGGQLQHPGIVPVYELGQFSDQRPFFSMKLVKGTTLAALLAEREDPNVDRPRLLGVFELVCQTMAYAHSRGVIHRDLKPANVMVGAFGEVQVMDWGLAKVLSEGGVADEKRALGKRQDVSIIQTIRSLGSDAPEGIGSGTVGTETQMGSVLGTPAYMPPEQALGEIDRLDERSDVFGLGAILCEILTGSPPYTGEDGLTVFRLASRGKLDDCFERLEESSADEELKAIVRDCLALEPDDRPRNAAALTDRVQAYLASVDERLKQAEFDRLEATTRAAEERKRRKVIMALAATVLLTCGTATAGWLWGKEKDATIARAAAEAKSQLQQQVSGELSTAMALGMLDSDELPNPLGVDRALAAVGRAENLQRKGDVDESLTESVAAVRTDLEALKRDFTLIDELENAWEQEMAYNARQRQWQETVAQSSQQDVSAGSASISHGRSDTTPELLPAVYPDQFYQRAFGRWGLSIDANSVEEAIVRIHAIDESLRPAIFASLDRWRSLLTEPRTIEQWQEVDWRTLQPVVLKSSGEDTLEVLDDESILATGPTPWVAYDLVFETDVTELSAIRIEAMLHDSLPDRGPGRMYGGVFGLNRFTISYAPRDDLDQKEALKFESAVADYSLRARPISTRCCWNIALGGGKPHVAVFSLAQPVKSESGFRIWLEYESLGTGQYRASNLGRFRLSATETPNNAVGNASTVESLARLVDQSDSDQWRKEMRAERNRGAIVDVLGRASDSDLFRSQPNQTLIQLADFINHKIDESQLMEALPQDLTWHDLDDPKIETENGTLLTPQDDGVIRASGPNPGSETITLTTRIGSQPVTAVRLELVPVDHPNKKLPNLSRVGNPRFKEVEVATGPVESESALAETEIRAVMSRFDRSTDFEKPLYPFAKILDRSDSTGVSLRDPTVPQSIIFLVKPIAAESSQLLRFRMKTGDRGRNIAAFRLSYTHDELPIDSPRLVARSLLEIAVQKDPADYWSRIALSEALQEFPSRYDAALRHATAAIALRPDEPGGHAALLGSLDVRELSGDSSLQQLALRHIEQLRRLDPQHSAIDELAADLVFHGHQMSEEEQDAAADQAYVLALRLRSPNPATYFSMANRLLSNGKTTSALAAAQMAVAIAPTDPRSVNRLGVVFGQLGNTDMALKHFHQATEVDPKFTEGYRNQATKYRQKKEYEKALEVLRRAIAVRPLEATNHNHLGDTLSLDDKPDAAIAAYRKAVELQPDNISWYNDLSDKLVAERRVDEAIALWERLIEIDPESSTPLNNLQVLLYREGRLDECIEIQERVVELDPDHYVVCGNMAYLYRLVGRIEDGKQVYRNALKLNDGDANLYNYFGSYLKEIEDYETAAEMYRTSVRVLPTGYYNYTNLADVLQKLDRDDEAVEVYRTLIKERPKESAPYQQLADLLWKQGRFDEVIPLFEQALSEQPDNNYLHNAIAWSLARRPDCTIGQGEWAVELASAATTRSPEEGTYLDTLGVASYRAGDWQQAINVHEQVIERKTQEQLGKHLAGFCVNLAHSRSYQAMAAFQLGNTVQAYDYLRQAEGALGHLAFAAELDVDDGAWAREVRARLDEARTALDVSTDLTEQERIDDMFTALAAYLEAYPGDVEKWMDLFLMYAWHRPGDDERVEVARRFFEVIRDHDSLPPHERFARALLSASVDDPGLMQQAVASARRAADLGSGSSVQRNLALVTRGVAEYRQEQYQEADDDLTSFINLRGLVHNHLSRALLFRSMARHHLGQHKAAKQDFKRAEKRVLPLLRRDRVNPRRWCDGIITALAYEEAKALLGGDDDQVPAAPNEELPAREEESRN